MHQRKRLRGVAACLGVAGMITATLSRAQSGTGCTGGCYSCQLIATSVHHTVGEIVYDDGYSNFDGGTPDNGSFNCGRQYLFTEYTGAGTNIALQFSYAGPETYGTPPATAHDVYIYNNTTHTLLTTSPIVVPDITGFAPTVDTLPSIYTSTPGELLISYYRHGATPGVDSPDIKGKIVLIRQATVSITAPPICSDFSAAQYNFEVHTSRPIDSIMLPVPIFSAAPCGPDAYFDEMGLVFDFSDYSTVGVHHNTWPFLPLPPAPMIDSDDISGNTWINPTTHSADFTDCWATYGDLSLYLPGGLYYGRYPEITLIYSDGVTLDTTSAIIPILTSALPASSYPGTPGPHTVGPLNATGVPAQSYDIYNYTVSGNEVWTPSNNPVANYYGFDVVDSVIRIQDSLTIPAGATLLLSGMTIEFGPGGSLSVQPAADSLHNGGYLTLDHTTLTAYRGCDGADTATWRGIRLLGNPAFPDVVTGVSTPQSNIYFTNSTISYADTGLQNGNAAGQNGGAIMAYYGGNLFYNNRTDVVLWPYNPGLGAGIVGTRINISNSSFIADANAWFTPTSMMVTSDCGPVYINNNLFANRTGATIPQAILATETSLNLPDNRFDSFATAVMYTAISGTRTIDATGNTFRSNGMGISVYGAQSPVVNSNTFYIPQYSGSGPSDILGSNALVVGDQTIGIYLNATTGYTMWNNVFRTTAPYSSNTYVTGTLEYNSGSGMNQVTGNTFYGLGTAMLSNFTNTGLVYTCNSDSAVRNDIAVLGESPRYYGMAGSGGIYTLQGTVPPIYTSVSLPTGNVFHSEGGYLFNSQQPITYNELGGTTNQDPASATGFITVSALTSSANCYEPPGSLPFGSFSISVATASFTSIGYVEANIHHYLNDSLGVTQRDSLYYWASHTYDPYGDLLITNLLIQDGYTDSAQAVYDSIFTKYGIDSASEEGNDFVQGRNLINLLVAKQNAAEPLMMLSPSEISTLQSVKANTTMWAHARAEGWLYAYEGDAFNDTLLYPAVSDSTSPGGRRADPLNSAPAKSRVNSVYPNPAQNTLCVFYTAQTTEAVTIEIQDISGRTVISEALQSGQLNVIDVSRLQPGMYLYRILEGNNTMMTGKVAKE